MSKLAEADRAHLEKNFVEAIELYRAALAQDPRCVRGLVRPSLRLGFPTAIR